VNGGTRNDAPISEWSGRPGCGPPPSFLRRWSDRDDAPLAKLIDFVRRPCRARSRNGPQRGSRTSPDGAVGRDQDVPPPPPPPPAFTVVSWAKEERSPTMQPAALPPLRTTEPCHPAGAERPAESAPPEKRGGDAPHPAPIRQGAWSTQQCGNSRWCG